MKYELSRFLSRSVSVATLVLAILAFQHHGVLAQVAPKIPEQAKKLYRFLGAWEGKGTLTMEGKTSPIRVKHVVSKVAKGWGIKMEETVESSDLGRYVSLSIGGYDAGEDMFHIYTVDNFGSVHDHKGKWTEENSFALVHEGMQEGKKFVETVPFTFTSPKEYHLKVLEDLDGQRQIEMDIVMKKK